MPDAPKLPPPWPGFLSAVDQSLSAPVELHCLGGFVLAVLYGLPRPTDDLDYIDVIPADAINELEAMAGRHSKLAQRFKVFLQHVGSVPDLPDGYAGRLVDLDLGLSKLRLKGLDPYDIVLSKLTRNSPKDREDVKYLASKLNMSFSKLYERFKKEMDWIAGRQEWHEGTLTRLWRQYFFDRQN